MTHTNVELKDFRQPLVTSLGVVLGFLLGFLGQWVTEDSFALSSNSDYLTFSGCVAGALLLLLALFRMLSPDVPEARILAYYRRTLRMYLAGIVAPIAGILVSAFV